jgi:hypothetical protein
VVRTVADELPVRLTTALASAKSARRRLLAPVAASRPSLAEPFNVRRLAPVASRAIFSDSIAPSSRLAPLTLAWNSLGLNPLIVMRDAPLMATLSRLGMAITTLIVSPWES